MFDGGGGAFRAEVVRASFGVPKAFTSDGGTYFTRQVMQMMSSRLGVIHHFGVANVSWSHGTSVKS